MAPKINKTKANSSKRTILSNDEEHLQISYKDVEFCAQNVIQKVAKNID